MSLGNSTAAPGYSKAETFRGELGETCVLKKRFCKARHLCFALFQDVGVASLSVLLALVAREALFDWPAGGVTSRGADQSAEG